MKRCHLRMYQNKVKRENYLISSQLKTDFKIVALFYARNKKSKIMNKRRKLFDLKFAIVRNRVLSYFVVNSRYGYTVH